MQLSLDYETYCDIDIRKVGLDAYTAHPSFEVMMAAYRFDDGPLQHWQAHLGPFPVDLRDALLDPGVVCWAFNAAFERLSTIRGLGIATPVEGWRCSMALAYMRGFTGGLAAVGEQMLLPLDKQKQKTGAKLIRKFCGPQRITRNQPHRRRDWNTDPDDWELFCEYNKTDVYAEEAVRDPLLNYPIPDDEWDIYNLDQRINDRGMPFDRVFAVNVARMSEYRREELLGKMRSPTGLENPNSQPELLRWLKNQGYPFDDIRENTVKRALALNLPCAEVLALRQWSAKTATKKAATALLGAGQDDRIRHLFQFAGASRTGRWAGRLVQSQNLARTPKFLDPEKSSERLDTVTDLIRQGDYEIFPLLVEEPMAVFGGTMRGMFRAPPGYMLHICDYSSIEAVGLAWVSRCERMLDVFLAGRDIYRDFGVSLYRKAYEEITGAERQVCKSACLGCFGADTPVLTNNGWKLIVDVSVSDRLFDGVEFVRHGGVVDQGDKAVIDLYGVAATLDHLIFCGIYWCEAGDVSGNAYLRKLAVDLARRALSGLPENKSTGVVTQSETRTYDILNCGARNRFVISTNAGPMIVHNCGYGLGPGKILEDGSMTGLLAYAAGMGVDISPEEAVVAVRAYRDTYAEVVSFWWACGDAAQAVLEEGRAVRVGALRFEYRKPFLLIFLPSGRAIYYYKPRMEMREIRTGKQRWDQQQMRMVDEVYKRNVLTVMGRNQRSTQWERIVARPSHLVENIIQALTRDILKVGLQRLDRAGFQIVGHAHDEIIVESPVGDNYYTWETMRELMILPIDWLPGFPLGAAGWNGAYYRK